VNRPRRSRLAFGVVLCLGIVPGVASAQSAAPSSPPAAASPGPTLTLPVDSAPLAAGHYSSGVFGPALTFDLAGDGWRGDETPGQFLELSRQMGDSSGVLSVSLFDGTVATDPCLPVVDGQVDLTAAAFTTWFTGLASMSSTTTPTTFAGDSATQVDATVLADACPNSPFLMLWDGFRLYPSEAMRMIAIDQGSQVIVITAETVQSTDLPDFLDAAQPVIDSMVFAAAGPGGPASTGSPASSGGPGSSGSPAP